MENQRPTDYCSIYDPETRSHLTRLIDWLVNEVISAGGDGDAIWYSQFYWANDLFELLKEYDSQTKGGWDISFDEKEGRIFYGKNQEGLLITNNKEDFDNRPSWQQCSICY